MEGVGNMYHGKWMMVDGRFIRRIFSEDGWQKENVKVRNEEVINCNHIVFNSK